MSRFARRLQRTAASGTSLEPSDGLWFAYPDVSGGDKLAFAHYFPPYPITFNNTMPDYYENNYLPVQGESGIHVAYGGSLRDRPRPNNIPYAGTSGVGTGSWRRAIMAQEVADAKKYHIDGFFCDVLGITGTNNNWERTVTLFDAASESHPGFYVIPMLDSDGSGANAGYVAAANAINTLLSKACAYQLPGGAYVVAAYRPESQGTSYWTNLKNQLQTAHGKTVELWNVFHNPASSAASYAPQGATGKWGDGSDPGVYNAVSTAWITEARGRGEKIIYPVWAQDIRPKAAWFDEARNSGSLRAAWSKAIELDTEMVQMTTWNDYSEGSQFHPSRMRGEALPAISAWYMARWKTGVAPAILRDAVFVSHRNQMLNATITGGQTQFMVQNTSRNGYSSVRQHVEVLTYLPSSDTVTAQVGGATYNYTAPAGEYVYTCPMQPGTVTVTTGRGVNLVSPITIRSTSGSEDRQYCFAYSIAGTTGQLDPTPAT